MDNPRRQRRRGRSRSRRPQPRDGSRGPGVDDWTRTRGEKVPELLELTPFSVFCAILGITETDGYARQEHTSVAKRFGMSDSELREYRDDNGLSESDLKSGEFDLGSARLDMKVAPEGISRMELARTLFEELREAAAGTS